jgi:hypothetical protein
MTFAIYALSQHPTVLARLRKEILDRLGSNYPTFDDIKEMQYLRAFINGLSLMCLRHTLIFIISQKLYGEGTLMKPSITIAHILQPDSSLQYRLTFGMPSPLVCFSFP